MVSDEERHRKAEELHKRFQPDDERKFDSDHPSYLSFMALVQLVEILADPSNLAFTRLDKGSFKNLYIDETELFAIAVHFSQNPLPTIERRLASRGIMRKRIIRELTVNKESVPALVKDMKHSRITELENDMVKIEEYELEPIKFQVKPLYDFALEWMMKRVAANGARIDEIIRFAAAARIGEASHPQTPTQPTQVLREMQGTRL